MYRLFDRHAQRPNRWANDDSALFAGEWFEIGRAEHDYMLELLPPLWMRYGDVRHARVPDRAASPASSTR
jgi:lipocalin